MLNKGYAGAVFTEVLHCVKRELTNRGVVYIVGEQGTGKSLAATLACFDVIPEAPPIVVNCACYSPSVMYHYFNSIERLMVKIVDYDASRALIIDGVEYALGHMMDKIKKMENWINSHDNLRIVMIANGNKDNLHNIDFNSLSVICSKSDIEVWSI